MSGTDTTTYRAYLYDIENRLVAATDTDGATKASFRYDPLGRIFKAGSLTFVYDGDALIMEIDGNGAVLERYAHGPAEGVDDPMVWYDGGVRRFLHADHQGSIVAVTDAAGAATHLNAYDEYGVPNAPPDEAGTTNYGRFQFTGQAWMPALGMYHYKARIYSPSLGRFLQTDPVGYEDQMNLYVYVGNDPVNGLDPDGQRVVWDYRNGATPQQRDKALTYLQGSRSWRTEYRGLERSSETITIVADGGASTVNAYRSDRSIVWNPNLANVTKDQEVQSPAVSLAHEVDHASRDIKDPAQYARDRIHVTPNGTVNEDKATNFSNKVATELGEPKQTSYKDTQGSQRVDDPTAHTKPRF